MERSLNIMEHLEPLEQFRWNSFAETVSLDAKEVNKMHPGRVLLEQFIVAQGISVFRLANEIGVSPRRLYEIVQGQRSISTDIAHRLAHYFGMSERYWLDLQARHNGKQRDILTVDASRRQSLLYAD